MEAVNSPYDFMIKYYLPDAHFLSLDERAETSYENRENMILHTLTIRMSV